MSTCAVHFMSLIWIHFLKRNNKGTQPWSNGNWPFSMENMSRRWFGDGVPAYLPPLFLLTKQAMSATRVRSTTAHMVPMIQPWVEMSLRWPSAPEKQNQDGELKDQCVFEYDSPLKPSSYNFIFDWNRTTWWIQVWEDVLTSYSTLPITLSLLKEFLIGEKQKQMHRDAGKTNTITFTTVNINSSMICLYCYGRLQVRSLNSIDCDTSLSSHLWLESG